MTKQGYITQLPSQWEGEQAKAAEQARRERKFTANVQQGVVAICERLHKGETSFIVSHGMRDGKEVVLYCYYTSERYIVELNRILNRSGWQVVITPTTYHTIDKCPISAKVIVFRIDKEE